MKRFLLLFSLLVILISGLEAQTTVQKSLGTRDTDTEYIYNGVATDSIGVGDSTVTVTIFKQTASKMNCHVYVDLDSLGGTADSVLISLKGKANTYEDFTSITTQKWYGSADTTFSIETSTSKQYKFWQLDITGYSDEFNADLNKAVFTLLKD